jgi:probable HAF family extracellular repeat protein
MQFDVTSKVGRRAGRAFVALSTLTTSLCLFSLGYSQATLTWLGTLGGNFSEAHAVSGDGSVVVGVARNSAGQLRAFRWTQSTGMVDLGTLGGTESEAWGVSLDGSIVIGGARNNLGQMRPFRWENNAMTDLGTLGGANGIAWGISGDGSTIVGRTQLSNGFFRAFRWQNNTMTDLGTFGGNESLARGVSYDGSVVAGAAMLSNNQYRPFRWTQDTGLVNLGIPGGDDGGMRNVSLDGKVAVGIATAPPTNEYVGIRWTQATGLQVLGALTQQIFGDAWGVSRYGDIIVGTAVIFPGGENNTFATIWTTSAGWRNLNAVYSGLLTSGSVLRHAYAISPCGRYIVGRGFNAATGRAEAFLLDTGITGDTNADGCVDDTDLLAVLFDFGAAGPNRPADVNRDNIVDDADLLIVLCNFGNGC